MLAGTRSIVYASIAMSIGLATASHAGYYATITPDGDFSDWANVPVATTASATAGTTVDFASLKIANDQNYIYFLISYNAPTNPNNTGVYMAVDSDNNASTGFQIYGSPLIGANFGFANDYPFTQTSGNFNSGGTVSNSAYLASPYYTTTSQQEIAIPLAMTQTDASAGGYSGLVFPGTQTIEFYAPGGGDDTLGPVTYSLAPVPEPASIGLLSLCALPLLRRRSR